MQLPQGELNRDFNEHIDGFAASARRAEPPLPDGGDSTLIQSGTASLQDRDVTNGAIPPHDNFENDVAGDSTPARLIGVVGLYLAQQSRRIDSAARPERSAPGASAGAVADTGAEAFTAAGALTGAGSATGPSALAFARLLAALHHAFAIAVAAGRCHHRCDENTRRQRIGRLLNRLRRRCRRGYRARRLDLDAT